MMIDDKLEGPPRIAGYAVFLRLPFRRVCGKGCNTCVSCVLPQTFSNCLCVGLEAYWRRVRDDTDPARMM